ncbi:MAG: T9SS type A sorting domain-containing protein [Sphingobacteriales bacterium]|nr:MAG: T9SS type A sorting domain-containing protein [Sphingobacteriales bacterium]
MKNLFYAIALLLSSTGAFAAPGDTTVVQAQDTLQLDHYGAYDLPVAFPSGNTTYRKIYMTFTLGTYNCPAGSQYCHQWDYDVHNVLMTPGGDTIELSRFITPYANTGVWRFPTNWTHRYVFDVTDYAPMLRGSTTFRIFYSGYSWGFTGDVKFSFIEGTPERTVLGVSKLWTASRTYGNSADPINNYLTPQTRTAPSGTQSAAMKVLITGHGSDANGCCEFASHNYTAKVNGSSIATVPVWRADCGSNDVYPQGGTWIYDRANWCPGAPVYPLMHPLTGVSSGAPYTAEMVFDPYTGSGSLGSYNIQANAIYYGGMNKTTDASMEEIYTPTTYEGYVRSNPTSGKPMIKVRNTGASTITAMQLVYGVQDSTMVTYNWTGSLASGTEDTLELPEVPALKNLSLRGLIGNYRFVARIASVNGSADVDRTNDTLRSTFAITPKWPNVIVVEMKTNNQGVGGALNQGPSETSWEIRNSTGAVVASRSGAAINTVIRDTVRLTDGGMYTFRMTDESCDGLNWWVYVGNPQIGISSGYLRIKNATNGFPVTLKAMAYGGTYESDFGCGFTEAFSAAGTSQGINTVSGSDRSLRVFPNPAITALTVSVEGQAVVKGMVELTDATGRVVAKMPMLANTQQIPVGQLAAGIYQVRYVESNGNQLVQRVTITK